MLVIGFVLVAVAACGSPGSASVPKPSPKPTHVTTPRPTTTPVTPAPTSTPTSAPTPAPSATPAATAGYGTAKDAADAEAQASGQVECAQQMNSVEAVLSDTVGVYQYRSGDCNGPGSAPMWVYVYRDAGGWHPYTWGAAQYPAYPEQYWGVQIPMNTGSGCVNVHSGPSVDASVVSCAGPSVTLAPAAPDHSPWYPPVAADGYIWWYMFTFHGADPATPLGWVDLEYLMCGKGPHNLNLSCNGPST